MRLQFADKHNLVVIQCDYFGSEFMQASETVNLSMNPDQYKDFVSTEDYNFLQNNLGEFNKIIKTLSKYPCVLHARENLKESKDNFNDMGFMQALDLLSALYAVRAILADNKLQYNHNKVIAYGHSHGAYLAYLCNVLAPHDFSLIIDNSGWLTPAYLTSGRYVNRSYGKMVLQTSFDYFAKDYNYDKEILNLQKLYKEYKNNVPILSFQGVADNLVHHREKKNFCDQIGNVKFHLINEKDVDNKMFRSTGHGLNADFIELFDSVMQNTDFIQSKEKGENESVVIRSRGFDYEVDYSRGLPVMYVHEKGN